MASMGNVSAIEFWQGIGLDPLVEGEYLQKHKLTDGLIDFLEIVNSRGFEVWCLSNDLSKWSRKLRNHFRLDKFFCGFIISSDVGARKPDQAIFALLTRHLNISPSDTLVVDDQQKNLDTASALGFTTVLFAPAHDLTNERHKVAVTFNNLLLLLS